MTEDVITAAPEMSVEDVSQLLVKQGISGMPVVDREGQAVGIFSETGIIGLHRLPRSSGGRLS